MTISSGLKQQAKWGYRRLLRASQLTFQHDTFALNEAKKTLRQHYAETQMETDPTKISDLIKGIDEVVTMFQQNIVQGKQNDQGVYKVKLTDPQKKNMKTHEELAVVTPDSTPDDLNVVSGCCQLPK